MKIAIASDHAGNQLRAAVRERLESGGHEVIDLGPDGSEAVDYPDFAGRVARSVQAGEVDRGVLTCGSGVGMSIAANRYPGVRAVLSDSPEITRLSREHNDSNVICFGERTQDSGHVLELLDLWLSTPFEGGRHQPRVEKIDHACQELD